MSLLSEPTHFDPPQKPVISNMTTRVLTAAVLLPIIVLAALKGGWWFVIFTLPLTALALLEFIHMESGREAQGSALVGVPMGLAVILAFHIEQPIIWMGALVIGTVATFVLETLRHPNNLRQTLWQVASTLGAISYVAFPSGFMVAIRNLEPTGIVWLFVIFAVTWGTDTFAYLGGRAFGKHKLAPVLSPKKTVEGALVGIVGGIIPAMIILVYARLFSVPVLLVICIGPFIAIAGDLLESAIKRFYQVKDSHVRGLNIFPGHGGVLDRIDALLLVTVLFYIFLSLTGPMGGA